MRQDLQIFALIATCNRPDSLARALRSVLAQRRRPDHLLIVDDSDEAQHKENEAVVNQMEFEPLRPHFMPNYRTKKRAAGAWNTGLDYIRRQTADPRGTFVAILDDDDRWEPSHLDFCAKAAAERQLDIVVAGIIRHDPETPDGKRLSIPHELNVEDLLVGGVAIQGSNLFVRLDKLLEAGCFDENLESATDRDISIRLADLGDVRFGALEVHTVHHDARGRGRISDKGSPRKKRGLDAFWRKYQGRMSDDVQRRFLERCATLFDWRPRRLRQPCAARIQPPAPLPAHIDADETRASERELR